LNSKHYFQGHLTHLSASHSLQVGPFCTLRRNASQIFLIAGFWRCLYPLSQYDADSIHLKLNATVADFSTLYFYKLSSFTY
jgi:hypothetical protein